MAGVEREGDVRTQEGSVRVFGEALGKAFRAYVFNITEADYRFSGADPARGDKIVETRNAFVQALADKLTTGKRRDTVLALDALLRAVDEKASTIVSSRAPYRHSV